MLQQTSHQPFCRHCGSNFDRDEALTGDDWAIAPHSVSFRGLALNLARCECGFLHTLAAAGGRLVAAEVIGARISDAEDPASLARTMAYRLRRKLPAFLAPVPFETIGRLGYRWAV